MYPYLKILEKDPHKLWVALEEYYDKHKAIIFQEAWRKWSPLRLMNYKSIAEFNSVVPKICCKLQFCDQIIDNAEIIKKTLSIFFFRIDYCISNTIGTNMPNILISYMADYR